MDGDKMDEIEQIRELTNKVGAGMMTAHDAICTAYLLGMNKVQAIYGGVPLTGVKNGKD